MKRLVFLVTLTILLVGLILLSLSDTDISIADVSIHNDEIASCVSRNSSATTAITMTGVIN